MTPAARAALPAHAGRQPDPLPMGRAQLPAPQQGPALASGCRMRRESALENLSNTHPDYVFWDGRSERETTVKSWNRVFRKLFAAADPPVKGGHPHRFRDTFAVSLLLKGVDLSHVSILLGHASIKITERHSAPWVQRIWARADATA